jgi:hypothetical protein
MCFGLLISHLYHASTGAGCDDGCSCAHVEGVVSIATCADDIDNKVLICIEYDGRD